MISCTRAMVAADTLAWFPLTTLETVIRLTPASSAMSLRVTRTDSASRSAGSALYREPGDGRPAVGPGPEGPAGARSVGDRKAGGQGVEGLVHQFGERTGVPVPGPTEDRVPEGGAGDGGHEARVTMDGGVQAGATADRLGQLLQHHTLPG